MKYLKSYESLILDNILDKISKYGMKSLKPTEKEYIGKYYSEDVSELEKEIVNRRNKLSDFMEYYPREDTEFFNTLGDDLGINIDFSKYGDDDIEEGRYEILYDDAEDEDIDHFIKLFSITDIINDDGTYKGWDLLSKETQDKFKIYIDEVF